MHGMNAMCRLGLTQKRLLLTLFLCHGRVLISMPFHLSVWSQGCYRKWGGTEQKGSSLSLAGQHRCGGQYFRQWLSELSSSFQTKLPSSLFPVIRGQDTHCYQRCVWCYARYQGEVHNSGLLVWRVSPSYVILEGAYTKSIQDICGKVEPVRQPASNSSFCPETTARYQFLNRSLQKWGKLQCHKHYS